MIRHYQRRASVYGSNSFGRIDNLNKAIDLFHSSGQKDSVLLGILMRDMGDYYHDIHNYLKADDCYREALELLKDLDSEDEHWLSLLNNYANNLSSMGEYEPSASILDLVCIIRESTLGEGHPDYLNSLDSLLDCYLSAGDVAHADSLLAHFRDALSMQPSAVNESRILYREARVAALKGEIDQAIEKYRRVKSLNPDLAAIVDQWLCDIFFKEGLPDYTVTLRSMLRRTKEDFIRSFYFTSERERRAQLPFLESWKNFVMKGVNKFPETVADAFEWNLFTKGLLFHTSAEINKILDKTPEGKAKWDELRMMRVRINAAVAEGDSAMVARLESEAERVERELNNEFVPLKKLRDGLDIQVKDVLG